MNMIASSLQPTAEGVCVQLGDDRDLWAVRGREDWYRCNAERGTCNCSDWVYRQCRTLTPCRHLRMLVAYLETAEMVRRQFASTAEEGGPPLPSDDELKRMFS